MSKPIKITGVVKNYDWGRQDADSIVFQYSGQTEFKEGKYAELWMGTHPNGPSLTQDGKSLSELFKEQKQDDLIYLFKLLSVTKCLSIQIHPTKQQAEELHVKDPKNYPDTNDKPELFLTVTPFKALLGFITEDEYKTLRQSSPFKSLKSPTINNALEEIMSLPKETMDKMVSQIVERKEEFKQRSYLIEKMYREFGLDVGILVSFLMNYAELPPGQAYYLGAGQPHAYVEGEAVELMKNSDNVVRLGLTPKFKDVQTLLKIINYENRQIVHLKKEDNCFKAGILRLYEILQSQHLDLPERSIGLIFEGEFAVNGEKLAKKDIFLVSSGKVQIQGKGTLYLATSQ